MLGVQIMPHFFSFACGTSNISKSKWAVDSYNPFHMTETKQLLLPRVPGNGTQEQAIAQQKLPRGPETCSVSMLIWYIYSTKGTHEFPCDSQLLCSVYTSFFIWPSCHNHSWLFLNCDAGGLVVSRWESTFRALPLFLSEKKMVRCFFNLDYEEIICWITQVRDLLQRDVAWRHEP